MRTIHAGVVSGALIAASLVAVSPVVAPAASAASQAYTWKNVEIQGGGFVPGIEFSPVQKDLIYSRTDIGGAYRWNPGTSRWVPLLDWVGVDNWGWNGVVSIAPDPVDANKVYAAVGMYTNDWDPNNGAILRSSDRGATWKATELPFKLGGNMPGRGMGERLAVDPNKNSILYFGAPSGKGLWRSTDSGATWSQVSAFPNPGDYVQDPANAYTADIQGVVWVTFDPSSGSAGSATQDIYVGVADKENTVYRSTNGGTSWEAVPGAPTGYIAHKGVLDPESHTLYLATSDTGGPYDGAKGEVWKLDTESGTWTDISPIPSSSSDDYFGYSGLTIDRQNPGTIMVVTQISWWPDIIVFRSTDSGATWTRIWDWASYPERTMRYTQDISSVPWLTFGANPAPPEVSPKLGWMTEAFEIDPFNSDRMMYGTGATIYGATDLTKWDSGGKITIKPMAFGLEETAVLDLVSPPSGPSLVSGLGDIGGFRHDDLTKVPSMMFTAPVFTSTRSLDYAEKDPAIMVRSGDFTDADRPNDAHAAFSTDGGRNWFQGTEPGGVNNGGTIAAAADGSRFVWAPGDSGIQVHYSVGFGNSWTQAQGIPANAVVESDRVNPQKFYGLKDGKFYVSTDGGATFAATAAGGLPSSGRFKAMPGIEGDIWLAGGNGLFHSTDSGASFAQVTGVDSGIGIGFGKAAPGEDYQALYLVGSVGGVDGAFRSDDAGASWVRINDDQHQYGNWGDAVTGDPRVYGRAYIGTNGRGILYADPSGGGAAAGGSGAATDPTSQVTLTPVTPGTTATPGSQPTVSAAPTATSSSQVTLQPVTPSTRPTASAAPTAAPSSQVTLQPVTPSTRPTASAAPTATVSQPAGKPTCSAAYELTGQWPGGFQGEITVRAGSTPIRGWIVTLTFPDGQAVSQSWAGSFSTVGSTVTAENTSWNGAVGASASTRVGFLGTWQGANGSPTVTCTAD
jgi:hypothetical protein